MPQRRRLLSDDKDKAEAITLEASFTRSGSVAYGSVGTTSQENFNGSWQKDITNQDPNQKVTCDVLVNGISKDHKEATGSSAMVICNSPIF